MRLELLLKERIGITLIHQHVRHPRAILDQRDGIMPAPGIAIIPQIACQRLLSPRHPSRRNDRGKGRRSEEHTSELQSQMRISYAVFCLKKKLDLIPTHKTNSQIIQ